MKGDAGRNFKKPQISALPRLLEEGKELSLDPTLITNHFLWEAPSSIPVCPDAGFCRVITTVCKQFYFLPFVFDIVL